MFSFKQNQVVFTNLNGIVVLNLSQYLLALE